ncbi:hypothetical protein [Roseibium aestuarii]|uniref:Uncharacterized protein n=1 Tax=Roseibium aestuarii TaxID=2600299 RepID=A0ABW4JXZ5_9HYPH|nr:hypothetical protein [Roseibium aestuarii]
MTRRWSVFSAGWGLALAVLIAGPWAGLGASMGAGEALAEERPAVEPVLSTYEAFFRAGSLDRIEGGAPLTYVVQTRGWSGKDAATPPPAEAADEHLTLTVQADGQAVLARKGHQLGAFPASVGNPVIMYFMETTLRDMARQSGGSPFYIRNRLKEALLRAAERQEVTVERGAGTKPAERVTIHPFAGDAERDRMGGFRDMSLSVTFSEEVPGEIVALEAAAPDDAGDAESGYRHSLRLEGETDAGQQQGSLTR